MHLGGVSWGGGANVRVPRNPKKSRSERLAWKFDEGPRNASGGHAKAPTALTVDDALMRGEVPPPSRMLSEISA